MSFYNHLKIIVTISQFYVTNDNSINQIYKIKTYREKPYNSDSKVLIAVDLMELRPDIAPREVRPYDFMEAFPRTELLSTDLVVDFDVFSETTDGVASLKGVVGTMFARPPGLGAIRYNSGCNSLK